MKIVIVGSGGRLGAALMREYREKFDVVGFNHSQLDLANVGEIHHNIDDLEFDVLINAAAFTNVDLAESQPESAFAINAEAPRLLAEICRNKKARLIHFSTDYVFDGKKRKPYVETDPAKPISVYGESKRAGEENVLAAQDRSASANASADRHLVVRVSWVFGPDRPSFIDAMIKRAREEEQIGAVADKFSTPTYTNDIARMLTQFFDVDVPDGVLHFANTGQCSWQEYAQHALDSCRALGIPLKAKKVGPTKMADMTRLRQTASPARTYGGQANWIARRPVYSVLSTAKYAKLTGVSPRSWRDAVADYIERSYSKK
ncbi:MAG TPA: dTDP-4-dehydrorhamnose reductase [Chthoniobacterales bacterium]|nr:dTDP-4-dehydrorhamnose reductase [Chthoniobacterales bacterium]